MSIHYLSRKQYPTDAWDACLIAENLAWKIGGEEMSRITVLLIVGGIALAILAVVSGWNLPRFQLSDYGTSGLLMGVGGFLLLWVALALVVRLIVGRWP